MYTEEGKFMKFVRMLETIFVMDSTNKTTAILKVEHNNYARLLDSGSIELDKLKDVLLDNGYKMAA